MPNPQLDTSIQYQSVRKPLIITQLVHLYHRFTPLPRQRLWVQKRGKLKNFPRFYFLILVTEVTPIWWLYQHFYCQNSTTYRNFNYFRVTKRGLKHEKEPKKARFLLVDTNYHLYICVRNRRSTNVYFKNA